MTHWSFPRYRLRGGVVMEFVVDPVLTAGHGEDFLISGAFDGTLCPNPNPDPKKRRSIGLINRLL